jgi:hypothetical protein
MKSHIPAFLAAAVFLSACSDQDWNHALTFTGLGGSHDNASDAPPVARAAPAPMTAQVTTAPIPDGAQPRPNAFCESVASQDTQGNNYDPATQRRVFVQSYQQCVAMFGDVTK